MYLSRYLKPCFLSTHCLSPLTPAHFLWTIDMRRAWLLIKFASFITFTCMKEISTHMHKYGLSFDLGTKDIHLSRDCQRRWFLLILHSAERKSMHGSRQRFVGRVVCIRSMVCLMWPPMCGQDPGGSVARWPELGKVVITIYTWHKIYMTIILNVSKSLKQQTINVYDCSW